MRALLGFLISALPALAAVQGVVANNTTAKPQPGVSIALVQPGQQGMQQLGTATSGADGTFTIDKDIPPGPALLQSTYQGVTYTQAIPPGTPTTGLRVNVYQATSTQPAEMSTQHLILLEPSAKDLKVSETFFTKNDSNTTYQDTANGSIRLYLPEGVPDGLQVTIDSVGVPIRRPVEKGKAKGEYKINYPLKPGETRFDLEYTIPAAATFSGKVFWTEPPTRLVTPSTVTLSGDGITDLGQEPQTQARVYTFSGKSFTAKILGIGSIRPQQQSGTPEENGAPKCCEETPARVSQQMYWVLGLGFAILTLGGSILFRKGRQA